MTSAPASSQSRNWGFWTWDVGLDRVFGDPVTERYFSLVPGQASHGSPLDSYLRAIHPDDRERVVAAIRKAVDEGADFEQRYRVMRSDGQYRTIAASGYCIRDDRDAAIHYPGMFTDVTDLDEGAPADVESLAGHLLGALEIAKRARMQGVERQLTDLVSEVGFFLAGTLKK
jgi:hypothetical protein